ncbi:unnamed protein product [Heterobilharzia americana]|nr:unnamed protein product [Heterobilharzia americana]
MSDVWSCNPYTFRNAPVSVKFRFIYHTIIIYLISRGQEELSSKLRKRPGHDLPPKVPTVAKFTRSSDSLLSNYSSSPNQKTFASPYSPYPSTTTPLSTHEYINSTPSSVNASGLISLQHRLAVSRPRNRRPPTKATNHQSENIDDNFVCFFSPSSSSTNVPINSFISTPNPQLDLIKEEGEVVVVVEEEEEINKTSDRATSPSSFDVDLTSFSSIINTEETIHDSQNSSQFNSPISWISLKGSTKSFYKSDSLKRESQPSLQPDYTTGWDHDTPTPYKPPKKGIGFERIKLNSFIESDRIITPLSHNHEVCEGETTQNSVKLKPVNILNDLDDKQQQQQQHDESLSFTSSESIPSIVFIPCKSSVEKVSRDCNEAKEDINDSGWPIVKKSISIDPEESTNKYSSSSLVQPMPILRQHAENTKVC